MVNMQKRQTGTKTEEQRETAELQAQIKKIIKQLGWSQNQFAKSYYTHTHDWDVDDEILKFQECFKKELQRTTTSKERLLTYLEFLNQDEKVQKMDLVANKHIPLDSGLSQTFIIEMEKISKFIDSEMQKKSTRTE